VALVESTITYLEMFERPSGATRPHPALRLALMRAEECTVSFYRYLYETVGTPWVWFERRLLDDELLAGIIHRPANEIFVLYVSGVPAGYFELDATPADETELCYFGLVPEFIGRGLGGFLLRAAIDRAWARPIRRFWTHTSTFDHPRALPNYQRCGFTVYERQEVHIEDPRERGILPRSLRHPRLPPLDALADC